MSTPKGSDSKSLEEVEHIDNAGGTKVTWEEIKIESDNALDAEKSMTVMEALRGYPQAIFWSWIISMAVLMEGFDTNLLSSLFAVPAFAKAYGSLSPVSGQYTLSAPWQSGISQASTIGTFIGIVANGWIVEYLGYRRTILTFLIFITGFIAIPAFAPSPAVLLVGELLCGIPWGIFCVCAPAYACEVAPIQIRGFLSAYVNLCFVIGHFLALGVLNGVETWTSQWAYRLPFCLQWMWPVWIFLLVFIAPESPWWLVRHGRLAEAEKSILRLRSKRITVPARDVVAMMVRTNQLEIDEGNEKGSFIECFRGPDLRRTEVACVTWMIQVLCGLPFVSWDVYFFEQAGLATTNAFKVGLAVEGLSFIGVCASWFMLARWGRRSIYIGGQTLMAFFMLLVGFLQIATNRGSKTTQWGQGAMLMCLSIVYNGSIGPLAYTIAAESGSTRLRGKTIAISRNAYNITSVVFGIVNPYMLNPDNGNWKGFAGFWWAGIGSLMILWTYFRLPEYKDRSYWELDILFERKVPARKFASTIVEKDADEHIHGAHTDLVTTLGAEFNEKA